MVEMAMDFEGQMKEAIHREKDRVKSKLAIAFIMLMAVYIGAIIVFHYVENWGWDTSLYFTTSTITTVGYGDTVPHTYIGKMFTIPLMWIGIAVGLYFIYSLQEYGKANMEQHIEVALDNMKKRRDERWEKITGKLRRIEAEEEKIEKAEERIEEEEKMIEGAILGRKGAKGKKK